MQAHVSVSHTRPRTTSSCCAHSPGSHAAPGGHPTAGAKCWLVGAGLGPAEYLTVKAVQLLKEADCIIYDDLGTQDALDFAPAHAERIYVGKRGGKASMKQAEIDKILVQECTKPDTVGSPTARKVVRLKGGDPAVFSRASSEAAALAAAGVPFEFVPGVSSALAAPLLAGLPLTDAQLGFSFAVVSGHDVEGTDWGVFARIPTLVCLMAGKGLPAIVSKLVASGWSMTTPVAVVRSAGLPEQRTWLSTLADVARDTAGEELSPCVVIVGQVAGLPTMWQATAAAGAAQEAQRDQTSPDASTPSNSRGTRS